MPHSYVALWAEWTGSAACRGRDTEDFMREKRPSVEAEVRASMEALLICYGCPVRRECLEYTFEGYDVIDDDTGVRVRQHDEFGVFGGTTRLQRRLMVGHPDRIEILLAQLEVEMAWVEAKEAVPA